jgi:ABC-type Na+ efflux pump permease subunit
VTRLKFANPVLDHEVRSKFIMRQPPLGVIIAEVVLALLVAYFYVRTLLWALFEPHYRPIIWWGLVFTGLIVTMMAAATMGSNGLSRERERGTWEGVRLSLLRPEEILRGKVISSLLTCALFSVAVWPLLLPCISWTQWNAPSANMVSPFQAATCLLIWSSTAWSYTLIGLWVGRNQKKSSRAAGQTIGLLGAFLLIFPMIFAVRSIMTMGSADGAEWILGVTHPLAALAMTADSANVPDFLSSGIPFAAFHLIFGLGVWWALHRDLEEELSRASD